MRYKKQSYKNSLRFRSYCTFVHCSVRREKTKMAASQNIEQPKFAILENIL